MKSKWNKLMNKKLLSPPWIAYPEIERYSIGWRMGSGEAYLDKWGAWFDALEDEAVIVEFQDTKVKSFL